MYQPPHFREDRLEVQHALIRAEPLGLLISHNADGLAADSVPFELDAGAAPLGILRAHLARANPHVARLAESPDVLVVFQGPQAYVSPGWYATKQETGKVVPTWNYVVVQAAGRARLIEDEAWLAAQIAALTTRHEAGRPAPWSVSDAPVAYIAAQMRGIVGLEIEITRLDGKWKMSQNRNAADRAGVARGLAAEPQHAAAAAAALVAAGPAPR